MRARARSSTSEKRALGRVAPGFVNRPPGTAVAPRRTRMLGCNANARNGVYRMPDTILTAGEKTDVEGGGY